MNKNLNISVIIPVYNTEIALFERAIKSIKFNCEIIVVNDGSDPEFNYICPGAKFINLEKNVGHLHARRIGVEHATGDWILFLDSDDEFTDNAIELIGKAVNSRSNDSTDFIQFGMNVSSFHTDLRNKLDDFLSNKTGVISPYVTNKLWRYECLRTSTESFENYPNVKLGEDHLIMINALFIARSCINVADSIYIHHEPHTCNKLFPNSTESEVRKVWDEGESLRESIIKLHNELKIGDSNNWDDLSFRLSTCRMSNITDTDLISRVTGKKVYRHEVISSKITIDTFKRCMELKKKYFKNYTTLCDFCSEFDEDDYSCRYENDMILANVSSDECGRYYSKRYASSLSEFQDEDGDVDIDKALNSGIITKFDDFLKDNQ